MNIDNTRAQVRVGKQQRMRSERIIDITVRVARSLPIPSLAHLKTHAGADDGERGSAAGAAPTAGNVEHLRDLKQIHDAAEHAGTQSYPNGQSKHSNERVEDARRGLHDSTHRRGIKHRIVRRTPPVTNYHLHSNAQTGLEQDGGIEPPGRDDEPHLQTTAPCVHYANNATSRAAMYVTIASAAGQSTSDVSTIAAPPRR